MKKIIVGNDSNRKKWKESIFMNIFYFCQLYISLIATAVIAITGVMVILFVLEKLFPSKVHLLNYAITEKSVEKMIEEHHYHQAIFLLEHKEKMIANSEEAFELNYPLYDCYMQVGEFSKAEKQMRKIMAEQETNKQKELTEAQDKSELENLYNFTKLTILRDIMKIYEKIGESARMSYTIAQMDTLYKKIDIDKIAGLGIFDEMDANGLNPMDGVEFDLIKGIYLKDRKQAIDSLNSKISNIYHLESYSPKFKITLMNRLTKWLIENNQSIRARYVVDKEIALVNSMKPVKTLYEPLGELSDYCYYLNDIPNAKKCLRLYKLYLDKTNTKEDFDYYISKVRLFKYLEIQKDYDQLEEEVANCCKGLKQHITNNFAGMTAEQREYFGQILRKPFEYAEHLRDKTHSKLLEELCFENKCFEKGLLMNSTLNVLNAVKSLNDTTLINDYNSYLEMRQELVTRQYITGPGNLIRKKELENKIEDIQAKISEKSEVFALSCHQEYTIDEIQDLLDNDEAVVMFSDNGETISAYILTREKGLKYHELTSEKNLINELDKYPNIYANENITHIIWDKVKNETEGVKRIYYTSEGILSKIAISTLPTDGKILDDISDLRMLSSISTLRQAKEEIKIEMRNSTMSIWGGICYSENDTIYNRDTNCYAIRGRQLKFLPGSLVEAKSIYDNVQKIPTSAQIYTFNKATERSFVSRSGKHDAILHISTHGFFQENLNNTEEYNPMHSCGLFFYNSNKYWTNDTLPTELGTEDGILRGEEVENCDFSDCKLVVLSACQTGIGHTGSSEGIYGLQRAFKLSGAQAIIMSLWDVDDRSTCDLMVSFYQHLSKNGSPDLALKDAKNDIRSQGKDPYYWGGFVLLH